MIRWVLTRSQDGESFLEDLDNFPSGDAWWYPEVPSSLPNGSDKIDDAIGLLRDHFQQRSGVSSPVKEESKQLWYSAPPRLQIYDEDVVNVFLNLGRIHLSSTFPIFSDFEANPGTNEFLCLAMAGESLTNPRSVQQVRCPAIERLERSVASSETTSQPLVTAQDSCCSGAPASFSCFLSDRSAFRDTNAT